MIEQAKIAGLAWTWPVATIEMDRYDMIKLLSAPDALITVTSEWKEVLHLELHRVPFFKLDREYLKIDPIPLRTARIDGPVWAKIVYSIMIPKKNGSWTNLNDDHEPL